MFSSFVVDPTASPEVQARARRSIDQLGESLLEERLNSGVELPRGVIEASEENRLSREGLLQEE